MAEHLLEVENLKMYFKKVNGVFRRKTSYVKAVDNISFTIDKKETFGLVGESGCGKTTTGRALIRLYEPTGGTIRYDGEDITKLPEYKRAKYMSRVFQDPMTGTAADMQIDENLSIAARRGKKRTLKNGVTKKEREEYREILKKLDLGLEDRLSSKVGLLSGGQRQAITLIMASLMHPKLLLLDEHTAALDPATAAKVLNITNEIVTENNITTVMVTHNMKDAIRLGNRLIMMYDGKIIYDVSGEEKKNLKVQDLLDLFAKASNGEFANDRMMLS